MAASNTRFTQNILGQSKTPIDSDHGIYRDLRNVTAKYAFERSYRFLVIHRISKIPRGPWVGASSRMPEGAFDDVPFIDALHANDL